MQTCTADCGGVTDLVFQCFCTFRFLLICVSPEMSVGAYTAHVKEAVIVFLVVRPSRSGRTVTLLISFGLLVCAPMSWRTRSTTCMMQVSLSVEFSAPEHEELVAISTLVDKTLGVFVAG